MSRTRAYVLDPLDLTYISCGDLDAISVVNHNLLGTPSMEQGADSPKIGSRWVGGLTYI
jgi:hypothetical protein